MASILDSFRETFNDRWSVVKFVVLAIPVYITINNYLKSTDSYTGFWFFFIVTFLLLFGFLIEVTRDVLNDAIDILPSLNPIPLIIAAVKGLLALTPVTVIASLVAVYAISKFTFVYWLNMLLSGIIWMIVAGMIGTTFLLYVKEARIKNAFNLKKLSDKSVDVVFALLLFLVQLIVVNLPTTGFVAYTLVILFGMGPILNFFLSVVLVLNIAAAGHYLAQLHFETFGFDLDQ